jgi:hypothetical protein
VASLAIFHLHPTHDDAYLRGIEAAAQAAMPSAFVAREGACLVFAAEAEARPALAAGE